MTPQDTFLTLSGLLLGVARGGQGGKGGDAYVTGPDARAVGGQGGEASQRDGRGGRGGRAFIPDDIASSLGIRSRAHMKWPYYEPITEPGRGADAPDTPQYMARRLIVEQIKKSWFAALGLPLDDVWWDREIVPLGWINERLKKGHHEWRADIADDEYTFTDAPN